MCKSVRKTNDKKNCVSSSTTNFKSLFIQKMVKSRPSLAFCALKSAESTTNESKKEANVKGVKVAHFLAQCVSGIIITTKTSPWNNQISTSLRLDICNIVYCFFASVS